MLDLYIFPLHRVIDPLQPELPGFLVVAPEKAGAKGRDGDLLILYISPDRPGAFTSLALKSMLQTAVDLYRKSHGTVTNGLRLMADHLNGILLERNLRGPAGSEPLMAMLNLVSIRDDILYIAQSGPTHSLFINSDLVQDYTDQLTSGRGLGSTSALNLKYYQVEGKAGDVFILAPKPPEVWTMETLAGSNLVTLEHLRKRLLNQADPDLDAVVVKFQTGPGSVHVLRPRTAQVQPGAPTSLATVPAPAAEPTPPASVLVVAAPPPATTPTPVIAPTQPAPTSAPALESPTVPVPIEASVEPAQPPEQPAPVYPMPVIDPSKPLTRADRLRLARAKAAASGGAVPDDSHYATPHTLETTAQPYAPPVELPAGDAAEVTVETPVVPFRGPAAPSRRPQAAPRRPGVGRKRMAGFWLAWKSFWQKLGAGWKKFFGRLIPVKSDQTPAMSPAAMLFIAIAVPLVVVAVAVTFYLQTGRADQRAAYIRQSLEFINAAVNQADLTLQSNDWTQATDWLDKADSISVTDESRTLRRRIEIGLDSADGIVRLDFKPLIRNDLPSTTMITHMVASSSDIYLLDSSTGNVLRLFLTGTGYELDKLFKCGPGANTDAPQVSALVDMVILPPNAQKATVLAMDSNGVLLYCIPGQSAVSKALVAPDAGWSKPAALAFNSDTLFVMDIPNNAVWVYNGQDTIFKDAPALFFDKDNPSLTDVIDLAFYGEDLYLLRNNGEITLCTAARCKDPSPFGDPRPSHDPAPTSFSDATLTQILTTQPPDPSLYLLDSQGQGVYHFSLLLNFQRQIRPTTTTDVHPPRQAPTAFTVSPTRQVVLAYGNQVYYGLLP